jgi:WD40 repeat protein
LSPVPSVADLRPSPDSSKLAIATTTMLPGANSQGPALGLLDLPASSNAPGPAVLNPAPSYAIDSLAWSPDGGSLAFIATFPDLTTELRVRNVATGEEQTLYGRQGESGALSSLDWSPSGRFLLTVKTTVDIATDTTSIQAIEIDVTHRTSFPVLTGVRQALTYTAADDSRISALVNEPGQPVVARTWLRSRDGTFQLEGSTELGKSLGIVGGTHLQLPRCALK